MNPASPRQRLLQAVHELGWHLVPFTLDTVNQRRKPVIRYADQPMHTDHGIASLIRMHEGLDWSVKLGVNVAVVDIESERHGGVDGFKAWAALGGTLDQSYVAVKTRSGGMHLYFRTTKPVRPCHIAQGVEIKAPGQLCHIPPSLGYSWGSGATFCVESSLPYLPEAIETRCHAAASVRTDTAAEVVAEGERRKMLCSFLGKVRNAGANEAELAAIGTVFRDRFENKETFPLEEVQSLARDYSTKEKATGATVDEAAANGDESAQSLLAWWSVKYGYMKDAKIVGASSTPTIPAEVIKDTPGIRWNPRMPSPGGVLEKWGRWANSTNKVAQADLHLFAAVVAAGTLIGPRLHFLDAKANLFGIGVARPGLGKQRVRLSTLDMFTALGQADLKGPECGSGDGFMAEMRKHPTRCFIWDEFGERVESMYSRNAPSYMLSLRTALKEAYSGGDLAGKALKESTGDAVLNPFVGLLGFVQPAVYQRVISRQNIEDGFIARFTVVKEDPDETLQQSEPPTVPPSLVADVRSFLTGFTLLNATPLAPAMVKCNADVVSIATRMDVALFNAAKARGQKDEAAATIMRRCREKFKKLALIHGVFSEDKAVTKESLDWAYAYTLASQEVSLSFLRGAEEAATDTEVPLMAARQRAVLHRLQQADEPLSLRDLGRAFRRWERPSLEDVLESLGERVERETEDTGGPKRTLYSARKNHA